MKITKSFQGYLLPFSVNTHQLLANSQSTIYIATCAIIRSITYACFQHYEWETNYFFAQKYKKSNFVELKIPAMKSEFFPDLYPEIALVNLYLTAQLLKQSCPWQAELMFNIQTILDDLNLVVKKPTNLIDKVDLLYQIMNWLSQIKFEVKWQQDFIEFGKKMSLI